MKYMKTAIKFMMVALLASFTFASYAEVAPQSNQTDQPKDDLANAPILNGSVNLTSPFVIFERPSEFESMLKILKELELEVVPDASLMAQNAESMANNTSRSNSNNKTNSRNESLANSSNLNENKESLSTKGTESSLVGNDEQQVQRLKEQNAKLKKENTALKQSKNISVLSQVSENVLMEFSREKKQQDTKKISEFESKIKAQQEKILAHEAEIKKLNAFPADGDAKYKAQIDSLKAERDELQKRYTDLDNQYTQKLKNIEAALAEQNNATNQIQQQYKIALAEKAQYETVAKQLRDQLSQTQAPVTIDLERLNREILVLKKAYQEEKQRADESVKALTALKAQANTQQVKVQQQTQLLNQDQSQQLLQLQQKAQLAELNAQSLQQKLQLAEKQTIALDETIGKLNAQITKANQTYQLQLADLQQRLLNAKRAEQEANRWARAAGSGNTNAASSRIINLQKQIDDISAAEEGQRVLAFQKQQEVINLQTQLNSLQAELNAQKQSKTQLENQLKTFEAEKLKNTEKNRPSANERSKDKATQDTNSNSKPSTKVSTNGR